MIAAEPIAQPAAHPLAVRQLVDAVHYAVPVVREAADLLGGDLDRLGIDLTGVAGDLTLALQRLATAEEQS